MKQDWETFKDNNLTDRAEEKFLMLPRLYKSSDGVRRYPSRAGYHLADGRQGQQRVN